MHKVLTIAGSDSGGGAGIQADLKTITALGGYGMTIITALTAQNTVGVQEVMDVPVDFIKAQFDSVMTDIGTDAAKTGMLSHPPTVKAVSEKITEYKIEKLVVDPVMVAKSGDTLLSDEGKKAIIDTLLPLAYVITPNIPEAEVLSGIKINGIDEMKRAEEIIIKRGGRSVVVKGGHLEGEATDVFYDGREFTTFTGERIETKNSHGTGCTFSAALATGLAGGMNIKDAIGQAKDYIEIALRSSLNIGKGHGPTDHTAWFMRKCGRYSVISALKEAGETLIEKNIATLIPEVQSNMGYALPYATGSGDVAAFTGRIVRAGGRTIIPEGPTFGASRHVANIVLTVMSYNQDVRCAMNIRFGDDLIRKAEDTGLTIGSFSRDDEPEEVREVEGSSLAWGVNKVLSGMEEIPDIIYDRGGHSKEPMIRVLGTDPGDVVGKVVRLKDR